MKRLDFDKHTMNGHLDKDVRWRYCYKLGRKVTRFGPDNRYTVVTPWDDEYWFKPGCENAHKVIGLISRSLNPALMWLLREDF